MILGAVVIVVIGGFVVNYFRNLESGTTLPSGLNVEDNNDTFPKKHVVAAGETLWSISEDYYDTGFNWTNIKEANAIANPSELTEGQEIIIPSLETDSGNKFAVAEEAAVVEATESPEATIEATMEPETEIAEVVEPVVEEVVESIEEIKTPEGSYTVVHGDNLWNIAVSQYGDGYKWVEIAKANDLVNPQIIHAGNVLILP